MDKVIAIIKINKPSLLTLDDVESIVSFNKLKEEAKEIIATKILNVNTRFLGTYNDDFIVEIPLESAEILKKIYEELQSNLEITPTIGVGNDIRQADIAVKWAFKNMPGRIKIYEPWMEEDKKENTASIKEPQPKDLAIEQQDKITHNSPEETHKSEPNENNKIDEKKDDDFIANDEGVLTEDSKKRLAIIVEMLKANSQTLESLREAAPEAYQAVLELVKSLYLVASHAKKQEQEKDSKAFSKVLEYIKEAEKNHLDEQSIKTLKEMIEDYKQKIEAEKEERYAVLNHFNDILKHRLKMAEDIANEFKNQGENVDKFFIFELLNRANHE